MPATVRGLQATVKILKTRARSGLFARRRHERAFTPHEVEMDVVATPFIGKTEGIVPVETFVYEWNSASVQAGDSPQVNPKVKPK